MKGNKKSTSFCSFCGKGDREVCHLIQADHLILTCDVHIILGAGNKDVHLPGEPISGNATIPIHICNECVKICNVILKQQKKGEAVTTTPPNHKE